MHELNPFTMSDTHETALARRIANRDTELHRAYDAYKARHAAAVLMQNEACDRITRAKDGLAKCQQRATEQGYPSLFTL